MSGVVRKPAALQVLDSRRVLLGSNSIVDSDGSGILLRGVSDSMVQGNTVSDDRAPGVRSQSAPIAIAGGSGNLVIQNLAREK